AYATARRDRWCRGLARLSQELGRLDLVRLGLREPDLDDELVGRGETAALERTVDLRDVQLVCRDLLAEVADLLVRERQHAVDHRPRERVGRAGRQPSLLRLDAECDERGLSVLGDVPGHRLGRA